MSEDGNVFKALLIAVPVGVAFWALVAWTVLRRPKEARRG